MSRAKKQRADQKKARRRGQHLASIAKLDPYVQAAMTGEDVIKAPSASENFAEWLKSQPASVRERIGSAEKGEANPLDAFEHLKFLDNENGRMSLVFNWHGRGPWLFRRSRTGSWSSVRAATAKDIDAIREIVDAGVANELAKRMTRPRS